MSGPAAPAIDPDIGLRAAWERRSRAFLIRGAKMCGTDLCLTLPLGDLAEMRGVAARLLGYRRTHIFPRAVRPAATRGPVFAPNERVWGLRGPGIERRTPSGRLSGTSLTAAYLAPAAKGQDLGHSRAARDRRRTRPRLHPNADCLVRTCRNMSAHARHAHVPARFPSVPLHTMNDATATRSRWAPLRPPHATTKIAIVRGSLSPEARGFWWVLRDSNPRHSPCKGDALPTELSTRKTAASHHHRGNPN